MFPILEDKAFVSDRKLFGYRESEDRKYLGNRSPGDSLIEKNFIEDSETWNSPWEVTINIKNMSFNPRNTSNPIMYFVPNRSLPPPAPQR